MLAELYIIPESFQHNNSYSAFQIENKVKGLSQDVTKISKESASNKVLVNYRTLYPVTFHSKFTVEDFICRPAEVKKVIDRDVVNALQNIFQRATNTSITSAEVIDELLPVHDSTICHGLIAFHAVEGISEEYQLIYGLRSWHKFRRHFLGLYPNSDNFIDECTKYFPNLFFHERNRVEVLEILDDFSRSIVKHLECLNDYLYNYRTRTFENESIKYQTLTAECNLEESAASKDNNDAKDKLTFDFLNDYGKVERITCYPHLRLSKSDREGDTRYYFHRIYFHEGVDSVAKKRVLIGHIGGHL